MRTKQFKAESKKLMDMMINSIYTHKEIFLRELISNASDALDKLYFKSLTDSSIGLNREDFVIRLEADKENRILKVIDNGCGMTEEELESNLGTIAKSGSFNFKKDNEKIEDVDIIGQFGVGFYSAFMVSDCVTVESKPYGAEKAYKWSSKGADGYTVEECDKADFGTVVTLHIKPDTDDENYSKYLEQYTIESLVKKYSDYIRHPIKMTVEERRLKEGSDSEYETVSVDKTLNSQVPIWKKNKNEVTDEEYNSFYTDKFFDYEAPLKVIHAKTEGTATYSALLFIPKHAPFDYYTKDYEKGLQLYSKGVLIMDKCKDLLPDYFSFVKGLVDSEDLSLNISREMLQHDAQLKLIAKTVEKKIKSELEKMLNNERETYEEFFKTFGIQLKFGVYNSYGMNKDQLKDLLLFTSSFEKKPVTLKEYVGRLKDGQDKIYYACGETADKIEMLPQTERVKEKGYEILYLTEYVDEFCVKMLGEYDGKQFLNICDEKLDLDTEEEKNELKEKNEENKELLDKIKDALDGSVSEVRFTNKLKNYAVCLTSEGNLSLEMEKVLNSMPNEQKVKADVALEINASHPIADKLKEILGSGNEEELKAYAKLLYAQGCLISGVSVKDPAELSKLISDLMVK
ncbi:MAG: molecular chaperone HtpG [Oscillospiraceae bacterium]|nr:molecular chaperone HtpG [Oscillospiraceae bacterium]MDD7470870.1 molecular chaperone HtpG [Oscillospiraceae bacterium]